jgi:zinc transporter 1
MVANWHAAVRSAAFILLQGVPPSVSLYKVSKDIAAVPGVLSVHDLHVWQLSETKMVASVHIMVSGAQPYMEIGREVTAVFHRHGIHSGTVQPEVVDDGASGTGSDKTCLITCSSEALGVDTCFREQRLDRS